jgi:hypothetical protein
MGGDAEKRTPSMAPDDWEFWARLARRMTDVLRSSRDNKIRFLWVDGVIPDRPPLATGQKSMLATAFVSENDGKSFVQYSVKLSFSEMAAEAYRRGKGSERLPKPGSTEWLKISTVNKGIEVDFA